MFAFQTDCSNLDSALRREWLETNGLGGFASSSVSGTNTRRYHGLLTASLHPPVDRYLLLSKLEETVYINGQCIDLSTNLYPGIVHPEGYRYVKSFSRGLFPVWTFEVDGALIEKRVFMVHGENTTVIEYEVLGDVPCTLEIRPLIAFRDYHSLTHANAALNPTLDVKPGSVSLQPYADLPTLHLAHNAVNVEPESRWYYNFEYPREKERGLEFREDLFEPFVAQFELRGARKATIIASLLPHDAMEADSLRHREIQRRSALRLAQPAGNSLATQLVAAADQFIVRRGDLDSVIAGYPWFSDWGRDTMIALPGLTLATGRYDIAREILLSYAAVIDRGMLPNRFPDSGEAPEYNTVDATLWYFEAIRRYLQATGEYEFVRTNLYSTLKSILDWHLLGTRHGIRCETDGLLSAGANGVQLTWMDTAATPRRGQPVEIQALWYNALKVTEELALRFGDSEEAVLLARTSAATRENFQARFWNEQSGCLYDLIRPEGNPDSAIRPNQVIALALGHCMVPPERAVSILAVVERELLTPFGLRTLARGHAFYHPRHDSDAAYHQGTIWPWLLGPFVEASSKFRPDVDTTPYLAAFADHLGEAGIGTISETFDGDAPHRPTGCIAQAWSVAEILRAACLHQP